MAPTDEKWRAKMRAGHRWGQDWSELVTKGLPRELAELEALSTLGGADEAAK